MPEITVCIPTYNSADTIIPAIMSILNQTINVSVEILLCDDGSSDDTIEIITSLQQSHENIRLLRNDRNRGRPYTRNRLVHEATGRYLTWLDADDEKYPKMLNEQYQLLERIWIEEGPDILDGTLIFTNFHWLWSGMEQPKLMTPPEKDYHMEELLNAKFGGYLWLMMGTTDTFRTIGDFDEKLPRLQDLDFFIRFAQKGGVFRRIENSDAQCIYYKDDRARGARAVWRSWTWIWRKHRLLFDAYGHENAGEWRRHHYRVSRRFAKADDDWLIYYLIAAQEILFLTCRRVRNIINV